MRKRDLDLIQHNLLKMRRRLMENLQRMEEDNLQAPPRVATADSGASQAHMADLASDHFDRENSLQLYLYEHRLLQAIDEALHRIKEGSYGICAVCSSPINSRRLMAVPNTKLCIRCQEEKERNGVVSNTLKSKS